MQHLLAEPGFAAFVAAVPRVGRVLRPVLRMRTVEALPAVLALPAAAGRLAGVGRRKGERPPAPLVLAWPRKGLPQVAKGAWFEMPGKNWGSGR